VASILSDGEVLGFESLHDLAVSSTTVTVCTTNCEVDWNFTCAEAAAGHKASVTDSQPQSRSLTVAARNAALSRDREGAGVFLDCIRTSPPARLAPCASDWPAVGRPNCALVAIAFQLV